MAEEKQGFEQLSQDDLNNVKAGIPPYESPVIVDLTTILAVAICNNGTICDIGDGSNCNNGDDCRPGVKKM